MRNYFLLIFIRLKKKYLIQEMFKVSTRELIYVSRKILKTTNKSNENIKVSSLELIHVAWKILKISKHLNKMSKVFIIELIYVDKKY